MSMGIPLDMHSDNSTTFQGADNELMKLLNFLIENEEKRIKFSNSKGIRWHFIPPFAPILVACENWVLSP